VGEVVVLIFLVFGFIRLLVYIAIDRKYPDSAVLICPPHEWVTITTEDVADSSYLYCKKCKKDARGRDASWLGKGLGLK